MADNVVRYEGTEPAGTGSFHPGPIIVKEQNLPLEVTIGLLIGLVFLGVTVFGSKWILNKLLGEDIGENKDDFLTSEFSAQLGVMDGTIMAIPVTYKWLPVVRSTWGLGRAGHPASLEISFTVKNPRNARLHVHAEGAFNKPMGSLPPLAETPPYLESCGYVLRLEPSEALTGEALKSLDEAMKQVCAGELYEAILEGNKLSFNLIRSTTYEIEETKLIMESGARVAALFN